MSYQNVWDMPLWLWRDYAHMVDHHNEQVRKHNAEVAKRGG